MVLLPALFTAANMLRLPRTATAFTRREEQQQQDAAQKAASPAAGGDSPTAVLQGPKMARSLASKPRGWTADQPAPEGHAQDVLHLLNAGWFGPLSRSKAAACAASTIEDSDEDVGLPPLPPRRGRQPQRALGDRGSDASPTSGSSQQSAAGSGAGAGPGMVQPTPARPILSMQRQLQDVSAAAAVQDLPGIGTWAGRYRLFGRQDEERQQQQQRGQPGPAGAVPRDDAQQQGADSQQQQQQQQQLGGAVFAGGGSFGSPVVLRPGGFDPPGTGEAAQRGQRSAYGSEQAQEDAWRWKFSRKWANEQQRFYEGGQPGEPASMVSDDLDAMAFTQACGTGVNLQVMPNSALRPSQLAVSAEEDGHHLGLEASTSALSLCQFDVEASYMSGGVLSAEMSPGCSTHGARSAAAELAAASRGAGSGARRTRSGGGAVGGATPSPRGPSATRTVLSLANKAQDLLQKQGAIEAEVQDRWERTRSVGGGWVGASLQAVCIDMLGRFKYCVLRVSDGAGHTRFLVRGRAGTTPAALLEGARQEAANVSRADSLPAVSIEAVGGGVMEWREDTERELYLQPSTLVGQALQQQQGDSPTKTPYLGDVSGLTASLVRQALPCHFRITTTASAGRSASGSIAAGNRI